jgi:hypothetical protein
MEPTIDQDPHATASPTDEPNPLDGPPESARSADLVDARPVAMTAARFAARLGVELTGDDALDDDRLATALLAFKAETLAVEAETATLRVELAKTEAALALAIAQHAAWRTNELIADAYSAGILQRGPDGAPSGAEQRLRAIAATDGVDAVDAELRDMHPLRGRHYHA